MTTIDTANIIPLNVWKLDGSDTEKTAIHGLIEEIKSQLENAGTDVDTINATVSALTDLVNSINHAPVTKAKTQPVPQTTSFTLGADQTIEGSNGQQLLSGRFVIVDPSEDMTITANSGFDIGEEWLIYVVDEDFTVDIIPEQPLLSFEGDTTIDSDIISNIADKTGIENGYTYVGANFVVDPATTVIDKDHGAQSIQLSSNATATETDHGFVLNAGDQGSINGVVQGTLRLRRGLTWLKLRGNAFGADLEARGDTFGGGAPFDQEIITAVGNTDMAGTHFNKSLVFKPASGTPTYTFLSESAYGQAIPKGTWIVGYWDGVATSLNLAEGAGVTLSNSEVSAPISIKAKGRWTAEYLGSDEWSVSGAVVV